MEGLTFMSNLLLYAAIEDLSGTFDRPQTLEMLYQGHIRVRIEFDRIYPVQFSSSID